MSTRLVGKPTTTKITRTLAEKYAGMTKCPGDRRLNPNRLKQIEAWFRAGEFRTCEWATAFCSETKETYRCNGKHTSTFFSQLTDAEIGKQDIYAIVSHFICDTKEDVAALYATFDSKVSLRTNGDINEAFAAADDRLAAVRTRIINAAVTGLVIALHGEDYGTLSQADRSRLLLQHSDFVLWLDDILTGSDYKHMKRSPVIAAMFKTYQKAPRKAAEFWKLVRDEASPDNSSPDRLLAKFLNRSHMSNRSSAMTKNSNRTTVAETLGKCITAWNAWRAGEGTSLRYKIGSDLAVSA